MIKRFFPYLIAFTFVSGAFLSCDKVDPPYTTLTSSNNNPGNPNDTSNTDTTDTSGSDSTFRKILIEDYTGFRCGNCPAAAITLYNSLVPLYGNELISMGVHSSLTHTYTNTTPPASYPSGAPVGSFGTDFRTNAGEAWRSYFSVDANPNGMVSRLGYPSSSHVKLPGAWGAAAQSIYHQLAKFKIVITNQYDSASGGLNCSVKVKVLEAVSGTYNLTVVLTEDNVVDWQVWYSHTPQNVPDYVHRHVLRGGISNPFGDQVFTGSAAVNDSVTNPYSINLLNLTAFNGSPITLNIDQCHVVAFVYDATTKEIWQAEEKKVQ